MKSLPLLVPLALALAACSSPSAGPSAAPAVNPTTPAATPAATSGAATEAGTHQASPTPSASPSAPAVKQAHFGYHGEEGPEHWGEVDPAWRTCASGKQQSPVDLASSRRVALPDPVLRYTTGVWQMANTGHALLVTPAAGSTLTLQGKAWTLKQFHFHTPSEHVVAGRPAAGELHLVHADGAGRLLVLGVLVTRGGTDNPDYDWLTGQLPGRVGQQVVVPGGPRDPRALLPTSLAHRSYQGSLTTPPCTEGVTWLVLDQPVRLSAGQVAALHDLTGDNARPAQPLNGRQVQQDTAS